MSERVLTFALTGSLVVGASILLWPTPAHAQGCPQNPWGCWGYNLHGGFASGWSLCIPNQSCKCALPARDWGLAVNNCNGQVP